MAIHPMKLIGAANRQKITDFLHSHLGASYKDIAIGTGLSEGTVRDHMKQIKAEWRDKHASLLARRTGDYAVQRRVSHMGGHAPALPEPEQLELFPLRREGD